MSDTATTPDTEYAEGRQLIQQLQSIRDSLADHADRHPRDVDVRSARVQMKEAIKIAIQAASKPHCEEAAELWLDYIVDVYVQIVRADSAALAHRLYS